MAPKRALLIVNAKARSGEALLQAAVERLEAYGITPVHVDCRKREDMTPRIVEHGRDADLVVVGGGDGTINSAAEGVMRLKVPLGILPLGTANDLARTLGIPTDLDGAARVIAEGRPHRIDLGDVNGHPFFNVASIGLSVELARVLTRDIKRRYGRLGYAFAAMRVLARATPFRATIISDEGSAIVSTLQIAVGNGRYYGGGMAVEKTARIDDKHLDLYSLELKRAWKLAFMAKSFRYGEHGAWDEVRAIRAKAFEIRTRRPRPVNADGEIVCETPARFTIKPGAVTVLVPD